MSGGGAGAPANTSTQVTTSNIPTYLQKPTQSLIGGAMSQMFNQSPSGQITSIKGYTPYGVDPSYAQNVANAQSTLAQNFGTVAQQNANPDAYNQAQLALQQAQQAQQQATQAVAGIDTQTGMPTVGPGGFAGSGGSAYVAGMTPMQIQAMNAAQGLQMPGQFGQATDYLNQAAQGSLGIAGLAPGLAAGAQGYGAMGAGYGAQGAGYGAQGAAAGQEGMQYSQNVANQAIGQAGGYGAQAANIGLQGLGYGAQGAGYGAQAASQAGQGYGAQGLYTAQATSPDAMQAYMNPYVQASLAPQLQQLAQQTGIRGTQEQAAATSSGAFGGSREALANALNQQAGNLAAQQAIGQGYNQAYQQAQQALQYGSGLGIQGLQAGTAAQQAGIQGAQTGIAGLSPALQGYQTGLSGVGQQIAGGQLGLAGANTAIQGAQTGISGAQAGMQGAQVGLQGVQQATAADQLGLQAYGQAGAQGTNLANVGNQQLAAQEGIIGLQDQLGGTQQQQAQNVINAAMQNYQTQQQYPYQQLGFLSSLLRGYPMGQTSQTYQAAPNPVSQAAGLGIAGLGMYNAMSDIRTKENIVPVGRLKNGLTQYEFNYKPDFGDPNIRYRGVMAQEVEQIKPEAVRVLPNGYKYVNYEMIGTRMEAV